MSPLPAIAHVDGLETNWAKILMFQVPIDLPKLRQEMLKKWI
jgi:hypothetical protein